jgi:hypothetical protein
MSRKRGFYLALRREEQEQVKIQRQIDDLEHELMTIRCFREENLKIGWDEKVRNNDREIKEINEKLKNLKAVQGGHCAVNDLPIEEVYMMRADYCEEECQYCSFCKQYQNLEI